MGDSVAVQVGSPEKPLTVKSAVSAGSSVAVPSSVVSEPEVQARVIETAGSGEDGWSGEKFLKTWKVSVVVLVMVQEPTLRRAEQVPGGVPRAEEPPGGGEWGAGW